MLLAHLADIHLGYRQYYRQTASGINQREADVARAFASAIDGVIAKRPDVVVVAGDLFHSVRPTNQAIVHCFRQFQRLKEALPKARVVVIAGNHDTPRATETGTILKLFAELGVEIATDQAERLVFPDLDLAILAVPHQAIVGSERSRLAPDGAEKYQVLVVHGEVEGLFPLDRWWAEPGGALIDPAELTAGGWTYVALGHYHVMREVKPRIWYSGALEYVTPNPWGELIEQRKSAVRGKGWLLVDLETGKVERQMIEPTRQLIDLDRIDGRDLSAAELDVEIAQRLGGVKGGIENQLVRLVVHDVPRHVARDLDHAAIRAAKALALHFHLDLRRPDVHRTIGVGAPGPRQTLTDVVRSYLSRRPLPDRVERDRFVDRGVALLESVTFEPEPGGLMQIRRLRLVNFRQHAETTLEFEPGLTGIVGPNGAGKSTLLEAIAWAMYGTQAARGNRDSIRRRSAPPRSRVEVELDFVLGAHRYRVSRSLQTAALFQDGEPAPIANSPGAVTDKVTRLLGMTREEFFNTYFTGQKELAIMSAMTAPERARFLSRVLGYERLATVQIKLKEERTAVRAALQTAESGLIDPELLATEEADALDRISRAEDATVVATALQGATNATLARVTPLWEEIQRRRELVQTVETDLNIAEHGAVEARRSFEALDLELTESLAANSKRDELLPQLAPWDELITLRNRLDVEAQAFAGRRALEAQVAEVHKQRATLDGRLTELPDRDRFELVKAELAVAQELAQRLGQGAEEQRNRWVRDREHAVTKRSGLEDQLVETREQLTRLKAAGPDGICPTCGKPLGKGYEAVIEDLDTRIADIIIEGRHFRARIDQLAEEPEPAVIARRALEDAEKEVKRQITLAGRAEQGIAERVRAEKQGVELGQRLAALEQKLAETPTSYDEAEHRAVRARLLALEPLRTELVRLTARAERAAALVEKAAEAEQNLTRIEARVASLRAQLATLGWSAERFDEIRLAFASAERDRQMAEVALVRAQAERNAAREHRAHVARRREDRDRRAAEVERLRTEHVFNQELDRAFTDLRDDLNATLRPDLADTASALLGDLTDGRYTDMELDEDYVATVIDDGEPKPVISGGEEDIANLALRLAISQMIADRAGQPFSLLVLDEIFGSLDDERRAAVVDLLRGLADRFPQVILITHIESVRDGFDRIVRIDYDVERGVATAREERPQGAVVSDVAA